MKAKTRVRRGPTVADLAEGVGVSERVLARYLKRGCPRTSVAAAAKWRQQNIRTVSEETDGSDLGVALRQAELAERYENARTRQLKNDLLEGRLIRKDQVERDMSVAFSRLVNRLNSLGLKCANICPAELKAPIKQAVEDTVRIAMKELCDDLRIKR